MRRAAVHCSLQGHANLNAAKLLYRWGGAWPGGGCDDGAGRGLPARDPDGPLWLGLILPYLGRDAFGESRTRSGESTADCGAAAGLECPACRAAATSTGGRRG